MAYAFRRKDDTAEAALRRIARERADAALAAMHDTALTPEKRVHEMRKNAKKLRALLRLVRPRFARWAEENAAIRDAARAVSGLRDRAVIAATLDGLAASGALSPADIRAAKARAADLRAAAPSVDPVAFAAFGEAFADLRARIDGWKPEGRGFAAFAPGLERVWSGARRRERAARGDHSHETVHAWRKRVKDHWYHATLFEPVWPALMGPHVEIADRIGETLGEGGDLWITAEHLADDAGARAIRALALAERERRIETARRDHLRLFADDAGCLSARWEAWWAVWRA
jgi:CHAD domain-containing protein